MPTTPSPRTPTVATPNIEGIDNVQWQEPGETDKFVFDHPTGSLKWSNDGDKAKHADHLVEDDGFLAGIWRLDKKPNVFLKYRSEITIMEYVNLFQNDDDEDNPKPTKKRPASAAIEKEHVMKKPAKAMNITKSADENWKNKMKELKEELIKKEKAGKTTLDQKCKSKHSRVWHAVRSLLTKHSGPLDQLSEITRDILSKC